MPVQLPHTGRGIRRIPHHSFPRLSERKEKVEWSSVSLKGWVSLNFIYQYPKKRRISTEYGISLVRSPCGILFISRVFKDLKQDALFLSFKNTRGVSTVYFGNGYWDTQGLRWWMLECWRYDTDKIVILGGSVHRLEKYAHEHYDLFKEVPIHGEIESVLSRDNE